jgi:hypothetical protein
MALYYLKSDIVLPPTLYFWHRIVFAYERSFVLQYELQDEFSISVKNVIGMLVRIELNM